MCIYWEDKCQKSIFRQNRNSVPWTLLTLGNWIRIAVCTRVHWRPQWFDGERAHHYKTQRVQQCFPLKNIKLIFSNYRRQWFSTSHLRGCLSTSLISMPPCGAQGHDSATSGHRNHITSLNAGLCKRSLTYWCPRAGDREKVPTQ